MNAILSILVCIAMLCGGGAPMPAVPETSTTWTLRNLTIESNGERVTLTPEARFTAAIGSEEAQAHFEIVNGEDVLLPMSGKLTADGALFSLGQGGNVYGISGETLAEITDVDAESLEVMELLTDFMYSCTDLMALTQDPEAGPEASGAILTALIGAMDPEDTQVDVEIAGATYAAERYHTDLDMESALGIIEAMATCGVPEMENYLVSYVRCFSAATGTPCESIDDFIALARDEAADAAEDMEFSLPLEITLYGDEERAYMGVAMEMDVDEIACRFELQMGAEGEDADCDMTISAGSAYDGSETQFDYVISCQMTDLRTTPCLHMDADMDTLNRYEYQYESDRPEGFSVNTGCTTVHADITVDSVTVDGLEDSTLEVRATDTYVGTTDGEETYNYSEDANLNFRTQDQLEDDGSVTTLVAMDIFDDYTDAHISFELNRAEGPAMADLADAEVRELTADTGDLVYGQLASEALSISADAMTLAADDSVIALGQMLGLIPTGEEADLTESEDYSYDYDNTFRTVDSFEEAAEIFEGEIPNYTAPEGYTLDGITAAPSSFLAWYSCGESSFSFSGYAQPYSQKVYLLEDGALQPVAGICAGINRYSDSDCTATVSGQDMYLEFGIHDSDLSMEHIEAILAGLEI